MPSEVGDNNGDASLPNPNTQNTTGDFTYTDAIAILQYGISFGCAQAWGSSWSSAWGRQGMAACGSLLRAPVGGDVMVYLACLVSGK